MPAKKLYGIKIIEKRPILQLGVCNKIVKIFKKNGLKISPEEARHLWDLHGVENGVGWLVGATRTDEEIFKAFEPYYFVDAS